MIDTFTQAIIAAAGPLAERRLFPDTFPSLEGELEQIQELYGDDEFAVPLLGDWGVVVSAFKDQRSQLLVCNDADEMIGRLWPKIEAVADRLYTGTRALTYQEVSEIASTAPGS